MSRASTPTSPRIQERRRRVAREAARLLDEGLAADAQHARSRAARRLGIDDEASLPRIADVDAALREHQRLFRAHAQPRALRRLREAALEAMRFLERFSPRLHGPVLEGTADRHAHVTLQLFCDSPEAVAQFLLDRRVPFQRGPERRLRMASGHGVDAASLVIGADGVDFELTVLPMPLLRQAPLDPDGQPLRRASAAALAALLDADAADSAAASASPASRP